MQFTSIPTRIILLLIFSLSLSSLLAQGQLQGEVVDAETGKGLSFATLKLLNAGAGLISNEDGHFAINKPKGGLDDTLVVSYLGYHNWKQPLSQIKSPLRISLKENTISLDEVVIIPVEPEELILQAMERVPDNYFANPIRQQAFYREFLFESNKPVSVGEAVLQVHKPPFSTDEETKAQVQLVKGRVLEDSAFQGISSGFEGGPLAISNFRVVPELYAENFLEKKSFKFYTYTLKGVVSYNDRETYHITFSQRKKFRKKLYDGEIFLDLKSLAFVSIRFWSNEKGRKFSFGAKLHERALLALLGVKIDVLNHNGRLDFFHEKQNWYPSFVNWKLDFNMEMGKMLQKRMEAKPFYALSLGQSQTYTRLISLQSDPIPTAHRFKESQALGDVAGAFDDGFWKDYNVMVPDKVVEEAVKELERKSKGK